MRADDAWLLAIPVCHVGGLSILTRCLHARAAVVLQDRFEAATILSVVPTMLARALEQKADLAAARAVVVGGAACPPALLDECAARGVHALTTYGLTETCAMVTMQRPRDPHTREPGVGTPLPGTEIRIQEGHIQVRGPTLFSGYLDHPPHARGAWYDTGDLGEIDDAGRLHVHTRRVDLIVTGGENVYPAEVEAALGTCDGVRRAIVFGVPDAEWGELVACAIESDPARPIPEPVLFAAMSRVLATHKRPRRVCFVEAIPTVGDKLDRARAKKDFLPLVRAWTK
jgi:O-succinylbenzoic acid--CoA ligase